MALKMQPDPSYCGFSSTDIPKRLILLHVGSSSSSTKWLLLRLVVSSGPENVPRLHKFTEFRPSSTNAHSIRARFKGKKSGVKKEKVKMLAPPGKTSKNSKI